MIKRQAMVFLLFVFLSWKFFPAGGQEKDTTFLNKEEGTEKPEIREKVFIVNNNNSVESYRKTFDRLIYEFNYRNENGLIPANIPKIAIKLETHLAPGLQTSKEMVDGLLQCLSAKGYSQSDIVLIDFESRGLVLGGFLSQLNQRQYLGYRVISFVDSEYSNQAWFHDSPIPPTLHDRAEYFLLHPQNRERRLLEERRSYLPSIMFLKNFHWINLAVAMDDPFLGIDAAAANISLGAVNNFRRFYKEPTMGPASIAEILAIPEFWEKRIFSIVNLGRFQFAGGKSFEAEFLGSHPTIIASANPILVDYYTWSEIAKERKKFGFSKRDREQAQLFKYAEELNLFDPNQHELIDWRRDVSQNPQSK